MKDLGLNLEQVRAWFPHEQDTPYVLVRVSDEDAENLSNALGLPVRRCYIADSRLATSSQQRGLRQSTVIAGQLPDPGSTMAGDFGEILVYLYQGTEEHRSTPISTPKWRLKEDRRKPAPYSDVVHLVVPCWPRPSADDAVLCAEVKTKSIQGGSRPIDAAIADSLKDCTSRLVRTLVWLRERALTEDLGDVQIEHLDRFINATDHPAAAKRFRAVAVVSADLVGSELKNVPTETSSDYTLIVISVPHLKRVYTSVFEAALRAIVP